METSTGSACLCNEIIDGSVCKLNEKDCYCLDGLPVKVGENCGNRNGEVTSPNSKDGIISSEKLADVNNPINSSFDPQMDEIDNSGLSPAVMATIIVASILVVLTLVVLLLWRRRYSTSGCFGNGPVRLCSTAKHNGPLSPSYASNPNYYSSGHDGSLLAVLRNLEISREKISFIDELGEGCFGKVYKGLLFHEDTSMEIAVKVLKENASPEAEADFQREVEIMSGFFHENILPLLGVVMKDTGPMPWMVFEYMKYGDLTAVLRKNSPHLLNGSQSLSKLDDESLMWIATQVAAGMLYLSQHHFVHRDLATRNCLVGGNLVVKISDFGMSRDIYTCDYYKIGGSRLLPVRWMAPESIMYGKFTLESDIWSYGVLLWEVFTYAKQPYYGHSNEEAMKLILHGILLTPPQDCLPFICDIMAACWATEPVNRITFFDIHRKLIERQSAIINEVDSLSKPQGIDEDNYLIPKRQGIVTTV